MAEPNVILVEGADEWNFLNDLLRTSPLASRLEIKRHKVLRPSPASRNTTITPLLFKEKDGVDELLSTCGQELRDSNLKRMGIVIDADDSFNARWMRLKNVLTGSNFANVPEKPDPDGTILENSDHLRVGIWIMPDNISSGMLEDFIGSLVPMVDKLWAKAEQSVDEVMALDQRFINEYRSKALIHTWLAWQEYPGTPLGLTSTRKCLDVHSPQIKAFLAWVSRLFELDVAS